MDIGSKIELIGKSRHGKNIINQFGKNWKIIKKIQKVSFSTTGIGPFLLLESLDGKRDIRWIATNNDPDFNIKNLS